MPEDAILDLVDNYEGLYNSKMTAFDRWVKAGDTMPETRLRRVARILAAHFAAALQESGAVEGKYRKKDIDLATKELIEQYESYRDEAIQTAVREATRTPKPEELTMDPADIEYTKKIAAVATALGVEFLKKLIPASPERVRQVLLRGDKYLNTIPLREWDRAAELIQVPGYSLSDKVGALKHVAKWHYA